MWARLPVLRGWQKRTDDAVDILGEGPIPIPPIHAILKIILSKIVHDVGPEQVRQFLDCVLEEDP